MGEVYKAKDLKLGRNVAIKVLQKELATDPELLKRFEREARAASALDHPNIITIHDITEEGGLHFIVMQHVEGHTIRELIEQKRLKLAETLHYAVQIADGLARAHSQGLVHRDLKPDNIMVTEDGLVKILDFGLAKLVEPTDLSEASTRDMEDVRTKEGHIVGTAPYMSPEQAQGQKVDARSDIFSFGSVLYEMVAGRRPFQEESLAGLLAAIIRDEPKRLSELMPSVPLDLDKVVSRTLQKDRERRFHNLEDVRVELQEIKEDLESGTAISAEQALRGRGRRAAKKRLWAAAGALILGLAVVGWLYDSFFEPVGPAPLVMPLTTLPDLEFGPAISPDGEQVVFVWNGGGDGLFHVYVTLIGGGEPLQLTSAPTDDFCPAWSPDRRQIAFLRTVEEGREGQSEVVVIPALGGRERRLGTISTGVSRETGWTPGLDWSMDGRFLAVVDRNSKEERLGVYLLSIETGEKQRITSPPSEIVYGDKQPTFSPDGKKLAFVRMPGPSGNRVYIQSLSGGEPTLLDPTGRGVWDLDWTADGSALVLASTFGGGRVGLLRIPADGGTPVPLPFGEMSRSVSIANQADRLVCTFSVLLNFDIWRLPGPGATNQEPPTRLIASGHDDWCQQYSPDGTRIAFVSSRSGLQNIWVSASDGTSSVQVTDMERGVFPNWSPDGNTIAFRCEYGGNWEICVTDVEGGFTRRLTEHDASDDTPNWSKDGRWIYFASNRTGEFQVWKMPPEGGDPVQVTKKGGFNPIESEDGAYVFYANERGPHPNIRKVPVEGGEEIPVLEGRVASGYRFYLWRNKIAYETWDGDKRRFVELFDLDNRQTTRFPAFSEPDVGGSLGLTVSPDGMWILLSKMEPPLSDIKLVESFR
jgi:Tol biopolymer transport system component